MEPKGWEDVPDYWTHWGFETWSEGPLRGLRRQVALRKTALLGEVARAFVWDHILWDHRDETTERRLLEETLPEAEVQTRRFLLVTPREGPRRVRAFLWGFRGYVEVLRYAPGGRGHRRFRDLTDLVDGLEGYRRTRGRLPGPQVRGGEGMC